MSERALLIYLLFNSGVLLTENMLFHGNLGGYEDYYNLWRLLLTL